MSNIIKIYKAEFKFQFQIPMESWVLPDTRLPLAHRWSGSKKIRWIVPSPNSQIRSLYSMTKLSVKFRLIPIDCKFNHFKQWNIETNNCFQKCYWSEWMKITKEWIWQYLDVKDIFRLILMMIWVCDKYHHKVFISNSLLQIFPPTPKNYLQNTKYLFVLKENLHGKICSFVIE